jgi:hypothetical protein
MGVDTDIGTLSPLVRCASPAARSMMMKPQKYNSPFALKTRTALTDAAEHHLNDELQSRLPPATAPPQPLLPPLENVIRPTVPTDAAAYYLNRKPQTLRAWACLESGPLRPVRINGRLAWSVSAIRALLNGEAK